MANHTYRHEILARLSDAAIRSTLRRTATAIRDAGGARSRLMRPPYGAVNSRVRSVVAGMGLVPVLWDIDSRDWESGSPSAIAARVLAALRPDRRNIVLLHDGVSRSTNTLAAVPEIVRTARARGYCFADLGADGDPTPPVPRARVSNAAVTEADPGTPVMLRFTLRLDRPTSRAVSVRVLTVARTATAVADFKPVDRRVSFPAGTVTRRVAVRVRGDRVDETRERLRLRLSRPRGLTIADPYGVGSIRDDDPPPAVTLTGTTVTEPAAGSVLGWVKVRTDRRSSRPVVLVLATAPGEADADDYVPFETEVVVAPGTRGFDVAVEVLADSLDEPAETFEVRVVSVRRATVAVGSAVIRIDPPQ